MEIEPQYGKLKPKYNYYDIDLVGELEPEWSKTMIKAISEEVKKILEND